MIKLMDAFREMGKCNDPYEVALTYLANIYYN